MQSVGILPDKLEIMSQLVTVYRGEDVDGWPYTISGDLCVPGYWDDSQYDYEERLRELTESKGLEVDYDSESGQFVCYTKDEETARQVVLLINAYVPSWQKLFVNYKDEADEFAEYERLKEKYG